MTKTLSKKKKRNLLKKKLFKKNVMEYDPWLDASFMNACPLATSSPVKQPAIIPPQVASTSTGIFKRVQIMPQVVIVPKPKSLRLWETTAQKSPEKKNICRRPVTVPRRVFNFNPINQ